MIELIRTWVLSLTGVALLSAAAMALTPEGSVKKVLRLVCGAAAIAALVSPALSFDMDAFAEALTERRAESEDWGERLAQTNRELTLSIIEEQSEAYILDKAAALGIRARAEVTAEQGEEYPYPYAAAIEAEGGENGELSRCIEAELGIPRSRQHWSEPNGD